METVPARARDLFFGHFGIKAEEPGAAMLRAVVASFIEIPYENITKIITKFSVEDPDRRMRDPVKVIEGYISEGTGGTCFSLTWCLGSILSESGFECHPVMADMKRPNIHCALVVTIGARRYYVDPGYLLSEPVELTGKVTRIATSFVDVELRPRGPHKYDLYTIAGGEKKWRYLVRTTPVPTPLFVKYWKESFGLPMMNSLQLTKLTRGGHLYIRDHHLRVQRGTKKTNENIRSNMEKRIETEFGIPGEVTARAREYIERMKESWRIQKRGNRGRANL